MSARLCLRRDLSPAPAQPRFSQHLAVRHAEAASQPARDLRPLLDLLAADEQAALRGLAIFRGGFAAPAAAQVADAPLAVLLALLNKSLLRQTPTGRYELHELVRQYAEEKLREHPNTCLQLQTRHARYYAAFLQEREAGIRALR